MVVVIAILAAITIVSYNGITTRANNTATVTAVSQTLRAIQAYIGSTGTYPLTTGGSFCVTTSSGCLVTGTNGSTASPTFDANMATIGGLPRSIPTQGADRYGIIYGYGTGNTMNGVTQPAIPTYWLQGTSQRCGVDNVSNTTNNAMAPSTTGYTTADDSSTGKTLCIISIPGP